MIHTNNTLNKVFALMKENKLREDMDDSLLEKLLCITKDGMQETGFIEELLKCSELLPLAQKVVFSLKDKRIKLSTSVKVFTLRLLGLIFEKENTFAAQKDSLLLREVSNSFKTDKPSELAPSIQDAVLSCIFSIGKHPDGTMWIINENLLDYAFASFSCTSYYVRKTAVKCFADALSLWTSPEFSSLPAPQQSLLNDTIKKFVSQIISGIHLSTGLTDTSVNQCCILTLKQALGTANIRTLVSTNFHLLEEITMYFRNFTKNDLLNESVLDLLLAIYSSDPTIEPLIKEIVEILVSHQLFVPAMVLASSFLSISEVHKPLSSTHICLLLLPLQVLSGRVSFCNKDTAFFVMPGANRFLTTEMESKSNCIKLISSSLTALSKLIGFMDPQALEIVLKTLEIAAKGPQTEQDHPMSYVCLENRSICLAILELFSCMLMDTVYASLNFESQVILMEYMLSFLERPSFDTNVLLEVLRLLKCHVALITKYNTAIPNELEYKLPMLLSRKLLDNKEPVVDNALQLAGQLISGDGYKLWKNGVSKNSIHMIIWEIAIEGSNEGFVKASALKVIIEGCLIPCYWEDIKTTKKVNEVDVMKILCHYYHNPDFFIQRESLACIHKWFQSYYQLLSQCKEDVFIILFCAVRSLDLELKLTALHMWQWIIDYSTYSVIPSDDLNNYLKRLWDIRFGASLMHAVEDYDDAVKFHAAKILLSFRQKLQQMGFTEKSIFVDESEIETISSSDFENNPFFNPISTAERDAGIETVLNITTSEQISNLYIKTLEESVQYSCKCKDLPVLKSDSLPLSMKSLWTCLWSEKLDSMFCTTEKSSSVFSEYSLSLLDDLIAAEETEINHCADDGLDCY